MQSPVIEQGSPEWIAERLGKVTASRISDVVAKTKSGWGASRANYMAQLIAERLTGVPQESFRSEAMQWGVDTEQQARIAYEFYHDCDVSLAGFVPHPSISMSGASPDGYVGADGLVEIKCPNTATHIDTLLGGTVPQKYIVQMQWQMACTGRKWTDFVSFDPRMPAHLHIFEHRVAIDADQVAYLEGCVRDFLDELADKITRLQSRFGQPQEKAA